MTNTFIYVQTVDTGLAPCVFGGVWSLALCKPTIRKRAEEGDVVIAITPKEDGQRLSSWAKINKQIVTSQFSHEYSRNRPDNIYESLNGKYSRRQDVAHEQHNTPQALSHDLGLKGEKAFVLISHDFFAFGRDAVEFSARFSELRRLHAEIKRLGRAYRRNFSAEVDDDLHSLELILRKHYASFHNKRSVPRQSGLKQPCETDKHENMITLCGRNKT